MPANTTPKPTVGSLVTGRSVCNDASAACKGVARAVVADQAALDARKKSRQAKSTAANATAGGGEEEQEGGEGGAAGNDKRSKNLFQAEARAANETAEARRSLGDVTNTVGLKTRDGLEVRAVTDSAAMEDRMKSRQAKSAAANGTAEARSVDGGLAKKAANDTADAGAEARKSRKSRRSHQLW